jgi:tetratricopeptide (TPR) repeat protein
MIGARAAASSPIAPCVAAGVGIVLWLWPVPVAAQQQSFTTAFTELTVALAGTYGDEGARIGVALDTMARALSSPEPVDRSPGRGDSRPLIDAADVPVLPPAAYASAYALVAGGEYAQAIRRFRDAAAADPLLADPAAHLASLRAAAAALRQNRLDDARSNLEATLAGVPASSEAHRLLGLTYWAARQEARSIEHFEAAIRLNPRDERSLLALAQVFSTAGRHGDAERTLRATLDALPESALAHLWLGSLYDELNRVPEARREYEQAAPAAVAGAGLLHAAIGRLAAIEGDFHGAAEAFARQVRAMPDDAGAHRLLARAYLDLDRVDDAFAELTAALRIDPQDADAYAAVGRMHLDAGRHAEAVAALRRALALKPALGDARYALAAALMRLGRKDEAAGELAAFERLQRQAVEDRRRTIAEDVAKATGALDADEGRSR